MTESPSAVLVAALVAVLLAISLATMVSPVQGAPGDIFDFHSMIGNIGGPSPGSPVVAGVNPAGAAWQVASAEADLSGTGLLTVNVQGLVLVSTLTVPAGLMVEATLACQTGTSTWTLVATSAVPVSSSGNAMISQAITPPTPCYAPIVLVRSATSGGWFATTGYSTAPSTDVVEFHSMIGNIGGPSPGSPVVAGVNPAGAAWVIGTAEADLSGSGHLSVSIQGLVLQSSGTVPAGLMVEATLACQTGVTWIQILTSAVPVSSSGNAMISQAITLPTTCIAPIILIRSATSGSWFAVTGFSMSGAVAPGGVPQFPMGLAAVFLVAPILLLLRRRATPSPLTSTS